MGDKPTWLPAGRTYVVVRWTGGTLSQCPPLGTVVGPSRQAAVHIARARWPAAGQRLRVFTAASAPTGLLARALTLDGDAIRGGAGSGS